MNQQKDLYSRLLELFPISEVKRFYNLKGTAHEVIDAVTNQNGYTNSVKAFFNQHFVYTRQTIRLFEIQRIPPTPLPADFPLAIESDTVVNGERIISFLPRTTFSLIVDGNPPSKENIVFFLPGRIVIRNKIVIIQFTKLKKTLSTYYPGQIIKVLSITNTDEDLAAQIVSWFGNTQAITELDINKGIKHLWDKDVIDSSQSNWEDGLSKNSKTMNLKYLIKKDDALKYAEIIKGPLEKSLFLYLKGDGNMCSDFNCDPTRGLIIINKSPKSANQVENVINQILANN